MKKLLPILLLLAAIIASCTPGSEKSDAPANQQSNGHDTQPKVEVIYFHGKQRCKTCKAIEQVARETVAAKYAGEVADGKLRFTVIDIDSEEGEAVADRYRIARSSLLVVSHNADGPETVEDITEKGFANARNNPEAFSSALCDVINRMLK